MSETKKTSWFTKLFIVALIFYALDSITCTDKGVNYTIENFNGDWIAHGEKYNPYNFVMSKGYYPVEYHLNIENGRYMLFFGSPGHLKLTSSGSVTKNDNGIILTGFDVENHSDYVLFDFIEENDQISSYCANYKIGESCYLRFKRR